MFLGLTFILIAVLLLPFFNKTIEQNLEVFLLFMGIAAALISNIITLPLILDALSTPLIITFAVLIASVFFRLLQDPIEQTIHKMSHAIPFRLFLMLLVISLGLISSIITAIIAAIVLVLIVGVLRMDRRSEIHFVILACFSIGLGAALTPIGEPLSTIATRKLNEDFFYLLHLIGPTVIPGIVLFGIFTALFINPKRTTRLGTSPLEKESYRAIFARSFKIYLFVMALTFLGAGFEPFIEKYLLSIHPLTLYWLNMISAVLDNATLAAAEISPEMSPQTIKVVLLGLLISGGMLIPGNIPNIIVASKLHITSKEWARFGLPFGLLTMILYFLMLFFFT